MRGKILVVDNLSTDQTEKILKQYASGCLTVLKPDKPLFLGAARNLAIPHVTTKYVAWLDSDDIWGKEFLQNAVEVLEDNSEVVAVCSGAIKIDGEGRVLPRSSQNWFVKTSEIKLEPGDTALSALKNMKACSPWSSYVFRTDTVRSAGGFSEELTYATDLDLIVKCLQFGKCARILKNNISYRVHANQETQAQDPRTIHADYELILKNYISRRENDLRVFQFNQLVNVNRFKIRVKMFLREHKVKDFISAVWILFYPAVFLWILGFLCQKAKLKLALEY